MELLYLHEVYSLSFTLSFIFIHITVSIKCYTELYAYKQILIL
jgi:hypothetical protein